jgi:hypothetical protein
MICLLQTSEQIERNKHRYLESMQSDGSICAALPTWKNRMRRDY